MQSPNLSSVPAATDLLQRLHNDLESTRTNLKNAQEKQKKYADRKRREVSYQVGDRVMLSGADWIEGKGKLLSKFWGPFTVLEVLSPLTVRLELPPSLRRIHDVFYVGKLKPFKDSQRSYPTRQQLDRPPPQVQGDDPEWEVEKVLDKRVVLVGQGRGRPKLALTQYLVHWLGYPTEQDSWEDEENLLNAPEAISDYEQSLWTDPVPAGSNDD